MRMSDWSSDVCSSDLRFGVNIIWPTLLLQARQLRTALAWAPSNSDDHAAVFDLESVIERAIAAVFRLNADDVLDRWRRIEPIAPGVGEALEPLGAMFCSWTGATRATRTGALLDSFRSRSDERRVGKECVSTCRT